MNRESCQQLVLNIIAHLEIAAPVLIVGDPALVPISNAVQAALSAAYDLEKEMRDG